MVTLEEIQERTGVSVNTIQYWRRQRNEGLLPEPSAFRKKVIYFDDSIIERVKFIKKKLKAGVKLPAIKEMLRQKDEEELKDGYDLNETYDDQAGKRIDAVAELEKKWTHGDRKNDVCLALALDPAISGQPSWSVFSEAWSFQSPVKVCVSIVSNGWVHFAKLQVNLGGQNDIEIAGRAKIEVSDYGMLLAIIGHRLAEENRLLNPADIPGLLFGSTDMYEWSDSFGLETLEEAKKLTRILRAGQEFVRIL